MKTTLLFLFLFISGFSFSQKDSEIIIEGRVQDEISKQSIPFVRVYNKTTKQGTITSETGYFRIAISSEKDTVEIKSIGYTPLILRIDLQQAFYNIELEPNAKDLLEVEVKPVSDDYLFDLLQKSDKHKKTTETAKSYCMLTSFYDTTQIELVEAYYNLNMKGYDIQSLDLKAGRLALQTFGDRYFTSQAGSYTISQLKLYDENDFFLQTPLNLSSHEAKKLFRLEQSAAYRDEKLDSIYVIRYRPKNNTAKNFEGKIWYNLNTTNIEKITMRCTDCDSHPFLPLFPTDSIKQVDLNITKTFSAEDGNPLFNHVDFEYKVDYVSRPGKQEEARFSIRTKAVLYAYDTEDKFELPKFEFKEGVNDYRKINAFAYNDFFWKNNNELDLNEQNNPNQSFFENPKSMTNALFFKSSNSDWKTRNPREKNRNYFEHPYIHWSTNRVFLREMIPDSNLKFNLQTEKSLMYNLNVQTFMDVNSYADSLNILTETVFDPYETFYYLPIDVYANCFINMYFDLCELQRRKLEDELRKTPNPTTSILGNAYDQLMLEAKKQQALFLKEVDRGTTEKAMRKWNEYILKELGIDNMSLFELEYN